MKAILAAREVGQQVLIGKAKPLPLYCFAVPIKDQSLVGILTQCSTLVNVSNFVVSKRIGLTSIAFLVDDKDRLVAHGDVKNLTAKLQDFSTHPAIVDESRDTLKILDFEGEKRVFVVAPVGLDWKLVVQQNHSEAYADYNRLKRNSWYLIIAVLVLVLFITGLSHDYCYLSLAGLTLTGK